MNLSYEYEKNAIIPPPSGNLGDHNMRYTRMIIDSKDRDVNLFPNPNQYEVRLEDDIEDVATVSLLCMNVPLPMYLVNKYFKTFLLIVEGSPIEITLTEGDYSPVALATLITSKLNAAMGSTVFNVEYDTTSDKFTFTGNVDFSISFESLTEYTIRQEPASDSKAARLASAKRDTKSLHMLLGFTQAEYTTNYVGGPYPYAITAPYRRNFAYNNYAVMRIDQFDVNKSPGNTLHRTFAVVVNNYNDWSLGEDLSVTKNFTPPLARLAKLRVSFLDRYGNLYDFQNQDHRFELLFSSHKEKRKYKIFSDR